MSSSTRELTVKVKADISSSSMNPSQAAYPGSPLLTGGGGGGHGGAGGANASGSGNPLAQNAQKAADNLKTFDQHLAKATESLHGLKESSKGLLSSFQKMLPDLMGSMGGSGGGGSLAQSLLQGSKSMLGKYAMPTAVGGGALAAAKYIWSSADAAGERFHAAGGEANLGHKTKLHDAQGYSYMHQMGLGETLRTQGTGNSWVDAGLNFVGADKLLGLSAPIGTGGGKVDQYGTFRSNDHYLNVEKNKFNERMRRDEMQHPISAIKMEGRESKYALIDQMQDTLIQGKSYKGYATDAKAAEQEHRKQFDDNIASSRNVYESVYGKEIGGLMAQREGHGADLQAQAFASEKAGVLVKKRESEGKGNSLQWQLARAHSNYNDAADSRDADMKGSGYKTKSMLDEQKNILRINDDIKKNKQEQLEIDKKMADLTTKALSAKKADTDSRLANAQSLLISTNQNLEGMKQSFGLMDEGDQIYEKDKADRFKKGGLGALSAEERQSMLSGPLGEDIRRQAIEKAEKDPAFGDMLKGSRMETNMNMARNQVQSLEKLSAEIKTQIDAKVELNPQELAKHFMEAMAPFVSKVTLAMDQAVSMGTQRAENEARRSAGERAPPQ